MQLACGCWRCHDVAAAGLGLAGAAPASTLGPQPQMPGYGHGWAPAGRHTGGVPTITTRGLPGGTSQGRAPRCSPLPV